MAYQGYYFIYDGTPSQLYGLRICSFESSGFRYTGGSSMELITDRATRSLKHTLLGSVPSSVLEFDLEFFFEEPVNLFQEHIIKSWLFGQIQYKKLFILNNDELSDVYFNCVLNDPEDIKINGNNGFKCTVVCDAGGAWEMPKTKTYTPTASGLSFIYNNTSGNNDYTYPTVKFTLNSTATGCTITNASDNGRVFEFTELTGGETIEINGDTGIIISSLGVNRLGHFNKNFLRLVRGANRLNCSGDIASLSLTVQNFRRLGG